MLRYFSALFSRSKDALKGAEMIIRDCAVVIDIEILGTDMPLSIEPRNSIALYKENRSIYIYKVCVIFRN